MAYVKRKQKNKKPDRKRLLLVTGICVVIAASAALGWWQYLRPSSNKNNQASSNDAATDRTSTINLEPATPEEKQAAEDRKDEIANEQQSQNTPAGAKVTPIITYAGQYGSNIEVSAYVPGIIENGGTCTLTAQKGSSKLTKTVAGVDNAQNTSCPTFIVSRMEFSSTGTWTVTVSYSSTDYSGTSASKALEVN